eukprot:1159227-Pelagomonas_calceolata.AAC.13
MLYGGNASLAALSDLPSEVAEVMAKDWPSSTAEAEEASNDAASGQFLDAPPTWPALPSNRARTYEWRCVMLTGLLRAQIWLGSLEGLDRLGAL